MTHIDMPALPMRVWEAIQQAQNGDAGEWTSGGGIQAESADATQGGDE